MKNSLCVLIILLASFLAQAGGSETCEPVVRYKDRIIYVEKEAAPEMYDGPSIIEVERDVTRKNRLSLLIGSGPSENINVRIISPLTTQIVRPDKDLFGVQYQRDFGRLTLGVMGLNNDSALVSIGINW